MNIEQSETGQEQSAFGPNREEKWRTQYINKRKVKELK